MTIQPKWVNIVIDEQNAMEIYRSVRWSNIVFCLYCSSYEIYNKGYQYYKKTKL